MQFPFKFIFGGASFATPCKPKEDAHSALRWIQTHIRTHGPTCACTRVCLHTHTHICYFYHTSLLIWTRRKLHQNNYLLHSP